jgi:ring-1,2-phenylacetyl-CoA epoxidase subunit PaaE
MALFHTLTVRDLRRETPSCVSVSFSVPKGLKEDFAFQPGQYLTLRTRLNGEEVRRSYSICTSPHDDDLRVAIKQVPEGKFSTFANEQLQMGDTVDVMPPKGNFTTPLDPTHEGLYVAYAAGSGITPVMSLLRSILQQEPKSRFMLFYGNRYTETIIFRDQLEDLKNVYLDRLVVHHILSQEHYFTDMFAGRISREKCEAYGRMLYEPRVVDAFFLCGPKPMIDDVQHTLETQGVDKGRIHYELFNTGFPKHQGSKPVPEKRKREGVAAEVEIVMDGSRFRFQMERGKDTVLDAAQEAGADLPFSCKGGICSTCRAKVLSGEVSMDVNYALEPEEVEQGYVLTCQSHPSTRHLVLDFDS